jgi:hypothetical protein
MTRSLGNVQLFGLSIILSACASSNETPDKPPIVEVFACSDYCPGPREKYLRNVYEGILDAESCKAIGGKPYSYIGWGNYFVCLAD